jgi:hypothetical protein
VICQMLFAESVEVRLFNVDTNPSGSVHAAHCRVAAPWRSSATPAGLRLALDGVDASTSDISRESVH